MNLAAGPVKAADTGGGAGSQREGAGATQEGQGQESIFSTFREA